ncbi:helix-turn-helix transcriptional regulator [Micrococcales bacterium 31B]|nr:helix-turn-helix transcriptional regulator [Micrococcales bacterium 31B]
MKSAGVQGVVPEATVGDRICIALRYAGVRRGELAARCGVHPTLISRWLAGVYQPGWRHLRVIASVCGVDYAWLATGRVRVDELAG